MMNQAAFSASGPPFLPAARDHRLAEVVIGLRLVHEPPSGSRDSDDPPASSDRRNVGKSPWFRWRSAVARSAPAPRNSAASYPRWRPPTPPSRNPVARIARRRPALRAHSPMANGASVPCAGSRPAGSRPAASTTPFLAITSTGPVRAVDPGTDHVAVVIADQAPDRRRRPDLHTPVEGRLGQPRHQRIAVHQPHRTPVERHVPQVSQEQLDHVERRYGRPHHIEDSAAVPCPSRSSYQGR